MKLSRDELRTMSAALCHALAQTADVRQAARYRNLRTKIDRVTRQLPGETCINHNRPNCPECYQQGEHYPDAPEADGGRNTER